MMRNPKREIERFCEVSRFATLESDETDGGVKVAIKREFSAKAIAPFSLTIVGIWRFICAGGTRMHRKGSKWHHATRPSTEP